MNRDETRIADLRAMLAVKREMLDEHRLERINLAGAEVHKLQREIREDEQVLRDLGVDDA